MVKLVLTETGHFDLSDWRGVAECRYGGRHGELAWAAMCKITDLEDGVSVTCRRFMFALASVTWTRSMHIQVITEFSRMLEDMLLSAAVGKHPKDDTLEFNCDGADVGMPKRHALDKMLSSYVKVAKVATCTSGQYLSVAHDKGDGGGLQLNHMFFSLRNNVAFAGAPQVPISTDKYRSCRGVWWWEGDGRGGV